MGTKPEARASCGLLVLAAVLGLVMSGALMPSARAYGVLVQSNTNTASGATSVSVSFGSGPVAGDLLVAICGANTASSITAPSGFVAAKNEATAPAQGIFYKVATGSEGTAALSCGGGATSTRWGMQIYEYSHMATSTPLDAVNSGSSNGSGTTASSGSVTATNANDLLIVGITSANSTAPSTWTSSFTQEASMTIGGGTKMAFGGADLIVAAAGTYSTTAKVGNAAWRGQIAAFKEQTPVALLADIVDSSGAPVTSPSVSMGGAPRSFSCQTVTGALGTNTQKIRINNTSGNPAWTLTMAATGGSTANWSGGTPKYDFNDTTGSGCADGGDTDTLAGDLTVNPAAGTVTPQAGCSATGVTLGTSAAFDQGATDAVTLATGSASAAINCYWDFIGISLSQTVPAAQQAGAYSIGMTLTITAN